MVSSDLLKDKIKLIDDYMLAQFEGMDNMLSEAMKYSLFQSGKRMRPLIMLLLAEELGVSNEKILPFCASIEMIHTYSLIHDDLPCLDNDDLRRGKPTCHKVYGDAFALLAGDALLNFAHETLLKNISTKEEIEATYLLSSHAGVFGMIGGQVMDIYAEDNKISEKELLYIHENKTGKLLTACFVIPFILKGNDENLVKKFFKIGMDYGTSFQVLDDILDVTSTDEILGKPVGSDIENNKTTYVTLYGLDKSKEEYERLKNECLNGIESVLNSNSTFYTFIKDTFDRQY